MWAILLIIAGVVLRANPLWFNGAATVGSICLGFGIAIVALWVILLLLAAVSS
jgi:hypothetical protein